MNTLKINIKLFLKSFWFFCTTFFTIFGFLISFIKAISDLEDKIKISIILLILLLSLILSLLVAFIKHTHVFATRNSHTIRGRFGNLFRIANKKEKKVIVIPVNDTFETIIDTNLEQKDPLISETSIHGQWIKYMQKEGFDLADIDKKIDDYLKETSVDIKDKNRGKIKSYPDGTIVPINSTHNTTFYLISISQFDEHNECHSSDIVIKDCVEKLLKFHRQNSQGTKLYIPLLGTGLSNANLTDQNSLDLIRAICLCKQNELLSDVDIVAYCRSRDHVSLY